MHSMLLQPKLKRRQFQSSKRIKLFSKSITELKNCMLRVLKSFINKLQNQSRNMLQKLMNSANFKKITQRCKFIPLKPLNLSWKRLRLKRLKLLKLKPKLLNSSKSISNCKTNLMLNWTKFKRRMLCTRLEKQASLSSKIVWNWESSNSLKRENFFNKHTWPNFQKLKLLKASKAFKCHRAMALAMFKCQRALTLVIIWPHLKMLLTLQWKLSLRTFPMLLSRLSKNNSSLTSQLQHLHLLSSNRKNLTINLSLTSSLQAMLLKLMLITSPNPRLICLQSKSTLSVVCLKPIKPLHHKH